MDSLEYWQQLVEVNHVLQTCKKDQKIQLPLTEMKRLITEAYVAGKHEKLSHCSIKYFDKMDARQIIDGVTNQMFHVTRAKHIKGVKEHGLLPQSGKRGIYSASNAPGIYLFVDRATAEDALTNWLADEIPESESYCYIVRVSVPNGIALEDDPEIAGSYIVRNPIPPENILGIERVELD